MLKIKLYQTGKKHQRQYRIVVMEAKTKRDGTYVESIGLYNPITSEVSVDKELATKWLENGAQPTDTVANILKKEGLIK